MALTSENVTLFETYGVFYCSYSGIRLRKSFVANLSLVPCFLGLLKATIIGISYFKQIFSLLRQSNERQKRVISRVYPTYRYSGIRSNTPFEISGALLSRQLESFNTELVAVQ